MAAVRTLVVTVSPLLADLVLGVLRPHIDLDIIGILDTREGLVAQLRTLMPDLVLLGLSGIESDACAEPLLAAVPSAEILALAPDGRDAWLYDMRPHRAPLIDFSVSILVAALASRLRRAPPEG